MGMLSESFGSVRLILVERRLTSFDKSASANSAANTSSLRCTYEQLQLEQLHSEAYRPCDSSEEHARNVVCEGDDMVWSTANASKLLPSNESIQD